MSSPTQIGTLTTWSLIAGGASHSVATKSDGTLWSWGIDSSGQVGDNTIIARSSPTQIGTLNTWVAIGAGATQTIGLESA